MRTWIQFLTLSVVAAGNECVQVRPIQVGEPTSGKVTIFAIVPNVTEVPASVALLNPKDGEVLRHFESGQTTEVPFGTYVARVRVSGFNQEEFELKVYGPDTSVRVPLHFGMACLPENTFSVTGATKGGISGRDLWVKLIPIAGNGGREVKISPRGFFLFDGVEMGTYILLLTEKRTLLRTQVINVDRYLNVPLDLN